jgi:hypothetical protein
MASYIDLEQLIVMFKTTYRNSYLRGDEVAKILDIRYGQKSDKKPTTDARGLPNSGLDED